MRNEKLITAREERGWTQEKAAEKIGMSRVAYARWEEQGVIPHLSTISMACEAFKMTPQQLDFRKSVGSRNRFASAGDQPFTACPQASTATSALVSNTRCKGCR